MMALAGVAGWMITANAVEPAPAPAAATAVESPQEAQVAPSPINRTGQVIAATQNSVTTSTSDGQTTTFQITPDTARIGEPGLKADVVVMGIVHDGVPVATAIADRDAVGPNGPPMDFQLPA